MKQNRTHKNRLLSLLLAAAIGIGGTVCYAANTVQLPFCSPYTAQAEEQTAGEFSYSVQNDTITITKYNGSAASVSVPAELDGKPVTALGRYCFADNETLQTISLPNSLLTIDDQAFAGCVNLQSFTMPDSVTSTGTGILQNCTNLKEATLSKQLTFLEDNTFLSTSLEAIEIPDGVTNIGRLCFKNTKLKQVQLPSSVYMINIGAFAGCSLLEQINLEQVPTIEDDAFSDCVKLEAVTLSPKMTELSSAFVNCKSLKQLVIPEGVKSIDSLAGCESLESITIPSTVKSIYRSAFQGCSKLKEVILPDQSNYNVFQMSMFSECTSLEYMVIPEGVTTVPQWMFSKCTSLEYAILPSTATELEAQVFAGCPNLSMVYIPDSVTKIDETALGYLYDESGNLLPSDQEILIITDTASSAAARYAKEKGYDVLSRQDAQYGDLNRNGSLDTEDLGLLQDYLLGRSTLTAAQYFLADVDQDGSVSGFDLAILKNALL